MKKLLAIALVLCSLVGMFSVASAEELRVYPNALTVEELISEMEGWYYYQPDYEISEDRKELKVYLARDYQLTLPLSNGVEIEAEIVEELYDTRNHHTYMVDGETYPLAFLEADGFTVELIPQEEENFALLFAEEYMTFMLLENTEEEELWYYSDAYGYRVSTAALAQFMYYSERNSSIK